MVNGMFEVVLSTLESKLRRVENLDRAVQLLVRKIDRLEKQVEGHHGSVMNRVDEHERSAQEQGVKLDKKLEYLAKKFDSVCEEDVKEAEEILLASPSVRRTSRILPNRFFFETREQNNAQSLAQSEETLEEVKTAVSGMDRRLAFHINIVSENLGKMVSMVEEVHGAVIEEVEDNETSRSSGGRRRNLRLLARAKKHGNGTLTSHKKIRKFDKLLAAVYPLNVVMFDVDEKVDLFQEQLRETKGAVDFLLPRSEELLDQNRRQEEALFKVKTELTERTEAIMQEIAMVNCTCHSSHLAFKERNAQFEQSARKITSAAPS
jgi:hypothetical protein